MATEPIKKTYHIIIGRFAPLHLGHQKSIDKLIAKYGEENVLLMIGSSDTYNERTPYTYDERKDMIKSIYPSILVFPLPDIDSTLIYFDGSTNDLWLDNISDIESQLMAKLIFVGGSKEDLAVLAERFETEILVERDGEGLGFSATRVREALKAEDADVLNTLLSPQVLPIAKAGYLRYLTTHHLSADK